MRRSYQLSPVDRLFLELLITDADRARRAMPDHEVFVHDLPIKVSSMGGFFPTQAEGDFSGVKFYFRARHGVWSLSMGGEDPATDCEIEISGHDETRGMMSDDNVMDVLHIGAGVCRWLNVGSGEVDWKPEQG